MNDRYQDEGPKGTTRKSAASAKPKSKAAASVHIQSSTKTPQERKAEQKKAAAIPAFFRIRRERGERERIKSPSRTF